MEWKDIVELKRENALLRMKLNVVNAENASLKEELAKKEKEYRLLGEYYEASLQVQDEMADLCWEKDEEIEKYQDKLATAAQMLAAKDKEIALLQQQKCRAEGKLEKAENYLRMFSGRENWQW